jgi:DNA-binding GntR family transcriptional regulator
MDLSLWQAQPLDRHNPIPLYQQLCDILSEKIRSGVLAPGYQLPSENDLINLFSVSRFVVRQTLTNLVRQGLIYTEQGRGSFVASPKIIKPLDVLQSYQAGMKKANIDVEVRILTKKIVSVPADIAEKLSLLPDEEVLMLERIAFHNNVPLNLLVSYISLGTWGKEKLMAFNGGSLYEHFTQECGIRLSRSLSDIEVIFAEEDLSQKLNLARGTVLLQISGVSFDISGIPVEYSRVVYPGSTFGFQFESYIPAENGNSSPLLVSNQ